MYTIPCFPGQSILQDYFLATGEKNRGEKKKNCKNLPKLMTPCDSTADVSGSLRERENFLFKVPVSCVWEQVTNWPRDLWCLSVRDLGGNCTSARSERWKEEKNRKANKNSSFSVFKIPFSLFFFFLKSNSRKGKKSCNSNFQRKV